MHTSRIVLFSTHRWPLDVLTFLIHGFGFLFRNDNLTNTISRSKDWAAKKVTIFNSTVHLVKTSENISFFICILPYYVADEITKEFEKIVILKI